MVKIRFKLTKYFCCLIGRNENCKIVIINGEWFIDTGDGKLYGNIKAKL